MLFSNDYIDLSKGSKYILEFDAWADEARDIVAEIQNAKYDSYALETVSLTSTKQHVKIEVKEMTQDDAAQLKFCFGNINNPTLTKVYIDNVSLKVE